MSSLDNRADEAPDGADLPRSDDDDQALLRTLDLSQVQIATLLGQSPQAVSKGLQQRGVDDYLGKDGRAQRLYQALMHIGGIAYVDCATRLRDEGRRRGWRGLDTEIPAQVSAGDLYASTDELWVFSDAPGSILDWDAMRRQLFGEQVGDRPKVVVFFLRTLDAAERWAEVLERESVQPATANWQIDPARIAQPAAFIYLIVTNTLPYTQDFLLADPGSRCAEHVGAARSPTVYQWGGSGYIAPRSQNLDFVRLARALDLGTNLLKANFFPRGLPLKPDVLEFRHTFLDGLIAIRGETQEEASATGGERLAGGVLAPSLHTVRSESALAFNRRAKFTPVFILVYKRRPGDAHIRPKTLRVLQEELDRARLDETDRGRDHGLDPDPKPEHSSRFW